MAFRVGQKVVCIGTEGTPGIDWDNWCKFWCIIKPRRSEVYTVRDTRPGSNGQMIRLFEIVNPIIEFRDAPPQEIWWWASAFRPAVERKTDISVFTKILRTTKLPAKTLSFSSADGGVPNV